MGTTTTTTTSTTTTTIPVPSDPFEASAFLAFRELGIPAIRYSVDEEAMVAAVVVEALDEAMLAALSDHKNVVADSVRPLVTLDAADSRGCGGGAAGPAVVGRSHCGGQRPSCSARLCGQLVLVDNHDHNRHHLHDLDHNSNQRHRHNHRRTRPACGII